VLVITVRANYDRGARGQGAHPCRLRAPQSQGQKAQRHTERRDAAAPRNFGHFMKWTCVFQRYIFNIPGRERVK
jgi:hypothetical protein